MRCSVARPVWILCLAVLAFPVLSARAEAPMATAPEECIFYQNPYFGNVDWMPEENLFLMATESGIRAFDVPSGAQRWHWPQGANVTWGRKCIVGRTSRNELFLLDKATGKQLWWRRTDDYGKLDDVLLSPDEKRIMAVYNTGASDHYDPSVPPQFTTVLYEVGGRRQRVFADMKDAYPWGFFTDGKTVLFIRTIVLPKSPDTGSRGYRREFFTMDIETGKKSAEHALPDCEYGERPALSPSGLLATRCSGQEGPTAFKVFNVSTGALLRDLGEHPGYLYNLVWSADEKFLYAMDGDRKSLCVIDAQTGALQKTFSHSGHRLSRMRMHLSDEGPEMVLSQDEDRNIWSWPLTPDAPPTKVFDGRRLSLGVAPEYIERGLLKVHNPLDQADVLSLYRIEGMKKVADWRLSGGQASGREHISRTLTDLAVTLIHNKSEVGPPVADVEAYAAGMDSPRFSCEGTPLAISPDGRFLVTAMRDRTAVLHDLETRQTVCSFGQDSGGTYWMEAAFSDDGRRVVVCVPPNLEVVDLVEGFPRRKMNPENAALGFYCSPGKSNCGLEQTLCFSPDGTLLLSGSYNGHVWLNDTETGALVRTLVEPRRYLEAQASSQGGFLKTMRQSAMDWAGLVTDGFKRMTQVSVAFSRQGDRAVTYAAGQVIRSWDSHSGELLQTIETGLPERRDRIGAINNHIVLSDSGDYAIAYNGNDFAPASLWSLADGKLIRRYRFPDSQHWRLSIALSDDAQSVYVLDRGDLYRWPGRPKDAP